MLKKKKILISVGVILALAVIFVLSIQPWTQKSAIASHPAVEQAKEAEAYAQDTLSGSSIHLSETSHFIGNDLTLTVTCDKDAVIYYTLDGSTPTRDSILYEDTIHKMSHYTIECYPFQFVAYFTDGSDPEYLRYTYFSKKNIDTRFDTMIFSITTDPDNLWDYEYGIFAPGKIRDEYLAEHPDEEVYWGTPGNYSMRGRESEREMYLEAFLYDGTCVISQNAGMRVYGGASRINENKSVRLFARKVYDEEKNDFDFPFFSDAVSSDGTVIDKYDRLVLRNTGNDYGYTFIRDELIQRTAELAGYQDNESVTPCCLFVNGVYYGFYWLHENYNDSYFEEHYGKSDGEFMVLEGSETWKEYEDDDEFEQNAVKEYNDLYSYYTKANLNDDGIYDELNQYIDIENYLDYYALNIYIDNTDWPENNYKTYRYYAADGVYTEGTVFDGRWRYLLHDTDYSMGIYYSGFESSEFLDLISDDTLSPLFARLMKTYRGRTYFFRKVLSLANGYLSPSVMLATLDEMIAEQDNELGHTFESPQVDDWMNLKYVKEQREMLQSFITNRPAFFLGYLADYYDFHEYTLQVSIPEGVSVSIDSYEAKDEFTGTYFVEVPVTLTPHLPEGVTFVEWQVDGESYTQEELTIVKDSGHGLDCKVVLVTE